MIAPKVTDVNGSTNSCVLRDSALNSCYPTPQSDAQRHFHDYVATNKQRAWKAVCAIETGNLDELGVVLHEAQEAFDRGATLLSHELLSPTLRTVFCDRELRPKAIGLKGVGSQGDGSVQILCPDAEAQEQVLRYLHDVRGMAGIALTLSPSPASPLHGLLSTKRVNRAILIAFGTWRAATDIRYSTHACDHRFWRHCA